MAQKPERPIEELMAGEAFRNSLISKADSRHHDAPLWYGWALMDAFLAGIDYARAQSDDASRKREG